MYRERETERGTPSEPSPEAALAARAGLFRHAII